MVEWPWWTASHLSSPKAHPSEEFLERFWALIVWHKINTPAPKYHLFKSQGFEESKFSKDTDYVGYFCVTVTTMPDRNNLNLRCLFWHWVLEAAVHAGRKDTEVGVTIHHSGSMFVHMMADREQQRKQAGNGGRIYNLQSLPPPWPTSASQAPPPNGSTAFKTAPQAGIWGPAGDISDSNNNPEFGYVCLHKQLFKFIITYVKHSPTVPETHEDISPESMRWPCQSGVPRHTKNSWLYLLIHYLCKMKSCDIYLVMMIK